MRTMKLIDIQVKERKRKASDEKVTDLCHSIHEIGLINPITVTTEGVLIAGFHRLTAYEKMGYEEIPVHIMDLDGLDAELAEIDENLKRSDLTFLEQGEQLKRREEILEQKGLRAESGFNGNQYTEKVGGAMIAPPKTTQDLADEMGVSKRSVQERKQVANNLSPEVRELISTHEMADNRSQLMQLARMEPDKQKEVAEHVIEGRAKNVLLAKRIADFEEVKSIEWPDNKYRVIYADPPWQYSNSGAIGDSDN